MGQKVSPVGLRIGINKDWESKWYANNKDFSRFLNNDVKIRKFLEKKFKAAGIAQIVIERKQARAEVIMYVSKPGLVIGQNGAEIEAVKKELTKLVKEDLQISVVEVKNPDLIAQLVANNIAHQIEKLNLTKTANDEFLQDDNKNYYKLITVQNCIANCVSWVPRLTVVLKNKFGLHTCS